MTDLLVARDLIKANAVKWMWLHTKHMLVDILTKMMVALYRRGILITMDMN